MCGIIGYIGPNPPVPIIIEGLRRLEYRGYDSAGIAIAGGPQGLELRRAPGKLRNLETALAASPISGTFGIGHTRWATHGRPTEENAHPHRDGSGTLVVVHNGIVENYLALKAELIAKGHKFVSETDTEIIAHLIENEFNLAAESSSHYRSGAPSHSAPPLSSRSPGSPASGPGSLGWSAAEGSASDLSESPDANNAESVLTLPAAPSIPLEEAVRRAVRRLTGAFAIGVLSANEPDKLVAARFGPPAVLGLGEGEYFLASDVPGILHHTRNIHFLADGEVAILTLAGISLTDFDGAPIPLKVQRISWDPMQAEKAGYKHFMLKEINEQPRAIRDTILGRVSPDTGQVFLPDMAISEDDLRNATQIIIAACGTSWHAGLAGKFMIERLARLRTEVDYASEYRYRSPIADPRAIGLLITQSGETADTIAAQRELIALGSKTLAICNVVGAAVSREAQGTITTNAGPEIGVASTKAFTAQLTALFLLALKLGQVRGTISDAESLHLVTELAKIPAKLDSMLNLTVPGSTGGAEGTAALIPSSSQPLSSLTQPLSSLTQPLSSRSAAEGSASPLSSRSEAPAPQKSVILSEGRAATGVEGPAVASSYPGPDRRRTPRLSLSDQCSELARHFSTSNDFLFLGRGIHYPIALEGALKLKEISYIHAEGYPAGEMKHGPNALIDETLPVVCIATQDPTDPASVLKYEKALSNIQEVTARSGRVIAIAIEGDQTIAQLVEHVIYIPAAPELLLPILEVVPLQLLAYHIAVRRGCDVDQPRNLAKSVTVE
jgi:glucosamine--fructose-6-phosphate aminotransferase (isomerizing)